MPLNKAQLVASLGLEPHPEGGYYRRIYESSEAVHLPRGSRPCGTAIHYLLEGGGVSKLHRLQSDELWFYHQGRSLTVVEVLPPNAEGGDPVIRQTRIGQDAGAHLAYTVKAGVLFGSYLDQAKGAASTTHGVGGDGAAGAGPAGEDGGDDGDFCLVSCVVCPGFDFKDWSMPPLKEVLALWKDPAAISEHDRQLLTRMSAPDA